MSETSAKASFSTAVLAGISLWQREVIRFLRQRSRVVGALGTPIIFWVLLGSGLGKSFSASGGASGVSYLEYSFPGTVILIVLFTAIFATISIIEDRREGFLQGVLVAPVGRSAIVSGKILGSSTLAVAQALLFMVAMPLAGMTITPSAVFLSLATLVIVSVGLSALGFVIAWRMHSTQGFHAIMNLFLIPMWLLSGAIFPVSGAAGWLGWIMKVNPLTYGVAAMRYALYGGSVDRIGDVPSWSVSLAVTSGFAVAMVALSAWVVDRKN